MTTPQRTWEGLGEPMGHDEFEATARAIVKNISKGSQSRLAPGMNPSRGRMQSATITKARLFTDAVPTTIMGNVMRGN